jgi:2,3-dimethylmalate lyase
MDSQPMSLPAAPQGIISRTTAGQRRQAFRTALRSGEAIVLPGVTDALTARLVDRAGFGAVYATGAGISNAQFGLADLGLISQTEMLEQARRIVDATDLPVVVDADTGYGGPLSAMRTTHQLIGAGAAGLQLEDQMMPKRCGHFDGQQLEDTAVMVSKLQAACAVRDADANGDERIVIIARTDARSVSGLDDALRRGHAFLEAGADVLFIEAPRTAEEMERIGREFTGVPLVANIVEGGKTPPLDLVELHTLGFTVVLYANFLMRAMAKAGIDALAHLYAHGTSAAFTDHLLSWSDRQDLFGLPAFDALTTEFNTRADAWRQRHD